MTFDDILSTSQAPDKLAAYVRCYQAAQGEDGIASQSALPLRDFAKFMADITVLEMVAQERLLFRLAGENVLEKMGRNLVGRDFLDIIPSVIRRQSLAGHLDMQAKPCGYFMIYENEYVGGQHAFAETLTLPLRKSPDAPADYFLGFHIQNDVIGVNLYQKEPALIVGYQLSSFVDIGFGIPDANDLPAIKPDR
ncbi:MAG: PAS domain-containing protein [Parvibaculum sp.]